MESFHNLESYGKLLPTKEPGLLNKYLNGKIYHGITVKMVAEDFVGRAVFSKDIKENYPPWVANEIFEQSEKIARNSIGYVPSFIINRKDFSENF